MRLLLLAVVLLLAVPLVPAEQQFHADLAVSMDVPLFDAVEVTAPPPQGTASSDAQHTCSDSPGRTAETGRPQYITYATPAGIPTLLFAEGQREAGCAEARFDIDLPHSTGVTREATSFVLSFVADRNVGRSAGNPGVQADQGVVFYAAEVSQEASDVDLTPLECFGRIPTFPNTTPSVSPAERIELNFELSRCDDELNGRRLVLAFYFRDASPMEQASLLPMPAGQQFSARVADVSVAFVGAKIPLEMRIRDGSDPEQQLFGYLEAKVSVPPARPGHHNEVSFALGNEWGIHALYKVDGGEPRRVGSNLFSAREDQGTLHFTLTRDLLDGEGSGEYLVLFSGANTGQVKATRIPLVVLALLAPLVSGLLAQRNLNHLYRSARGRISAQRAVLQAALVAAWATYVGVAVTLVIRSSGMGMAAWPMPVGNIIAYALLGLTIVAMVLVGVFARRREMVLVLDDLSELERIQTELERSNRELEQFAYVASHDLKEPLRMVAGYTQLLEMRYGKKLDDSGKEFLNFATEGARRLQHMVDDLLAYSRVRTDHATFREIDLNDVMVIVEGHLRALIAERNVRVQYNNLPRLHADQSQMVQLLLNLVQNAIKFSPQDDPLVEITAERAGEGYRIRVRDEGIGIEPAQQARVFQIFQRLHLREAYEGNGIGLAVCKKIVEQWGGTIQIQSSKGNGSTFVVTLPDLRPRPARTTRVAEAARAARPGDSPA